MLIWRIISPLFLTILLVACAPPTSDDSSEGRAGASLVEMVEGDYVPGEILVGIELGGGAERSAIELSAPRRDPVDRIPGARTLDVLTFPSTTDTRRAAAVNSTEITVERIALPAGMSIEAARTLLLSESGVLYVEPNRIVRRAFVPNDPYFTKQWGLFNDGQTISGNKGTITGTVGVDIGATNAWEINSKADIIVAMIDSGIDLQHPDLAENLWNNPGEVAGNNLDDDKNGYRDDLHGWSFVANSPTPQDDDIDGHGTHTAGIVGAISNNDLGVSSAASARLMPLKFLDAWGGGTLYNAAAAIRYAVNNGARIINASYTYPQSCIPTSPDTTERLAIDYARQQGVLIVAAAGNFGCNNDYTPFYPASHGLDNILSVAATDSLDHLASWSGVGSNYGLRSVHLGAPGHNIYSTIPMAMRGAESDGVLGYGFLSGTSMAAPMVSSAAAFLWANNPDWSYSQVRETLMATVDPVPALANTTISRGRVNLFRALQGAGYDPPAPPSELQVTFASGTATLNWRDNAKNETGYIVERAVEDSSFIELQRLDPNSTSYSDVLNFDGGRLRYRVKAMMDSLFSPYSNEAEVVLDLPPPSQLAAVIAETSGISLTWQDNSFSEEFFAIERRNDGEVKFTEIATTAANATSYLDRSAKDQPPYHYRVRAGRSNGTYSAYSNEATGTKLLDPGGCSSGCFIATAAWGSPWGREVTSLRRFRDQVLLKSTAGRLFVSGYYKLSPPLAQMIARHDRCRALVRWLLTPFVAIAETMAPEPETETLPAGRSAKRP